MRKEKTTEISRGVGTFMKKFSEPEVTIDVFEDDEVLTESVEVTWDSENWGDGWNND